MGHKERSRKYLALSVAELLLVAYSIGNASAKVDCGPVVNKGNEIARSVAIGTSPAGTGAFSLGSGLAAVASKATPIIAKVQPYAGPNTFVPLLESGELEFGIINILDAYMAMTGTGTYKKAYPSLRVLTGGVFPFTGGIMVRDKSDIRQVSDLKGKRLAWDFGGHAVIQALLNAALETGGIKPTDITQVRLTTSNDGIRGVAEGKVDATYASLGTGTNEEANAMEPVRFLSIPNSEANGKILAKLGASVVKAEAATGVRGDTNIIGYPLHLLTSTKVNERTVAVVLKAWWDNHAELQTIHPLFKQFTKDVQAISNFTIPYHPGAVKFYKEVGVWGAKQDARTKEICG